MVIAMNKVLENIFRFSEQGLQEGEEAAIVRRR